MSVYETPYYGQRRKALTGQGYGPYYGMSLSGGGNLEPQSRRALPPEISDKYGATGTPAITEGAEGVAQEGLESSMAGTPGATMGQLAFNMGLPFGSPPPGTAQAKSGLLRGVLNVAPTVASKLTGLPTFSFVQFTRNFLTPIMAKAFPNLFTFTPPTQQELDEDEAMDALEELGLPPVAEEPSILESNAMGVMGPGTGGLGSATGIGAGEGGAEGGY
jgi:hypothetical protein